MSPVFLARCCCWLSSPIGSLLLTFTTRGLARVEFLEAENPGNQGVPRNSPGLPPGDLLPLIETTLQALTAYFSGTPQDFQSLPLDLQGTPFQRLVWEQLQAIPWGTTISYSELARRVGRPGGAQAVGQANAANPLPIIIPCHRVIAADGTLGGYSPGLERKRWLLEHEKALVGGGSGTGIPAGSQGCWPSSQAPFPITSPHSLKADRCGKDCSLGGRRPSRN